MALSDRLLAAVPVAFSFLVVASLYVWQASRHPTPWLFSDEIEYTQISRAIAETGKPARRGVEYWGAGLFPWLIAPFWWIDHTESAYGAVKTFNSLVMTAAMFPTYLLARMVMARPYALLAAVGSALAPFFIYSAMVMQEPIAYFAAALAFYVTARLLVEATRWNIAAAVGTAVVTPFIRDELIIVPGDHARGPRTPLRLARPRAGRGRSRLLAPARRLRGLGACGARGPRRGGPSRRDAGGGGDAIAGDDARPDALGVGRADRRRRCAARRDRAGDDRSRRLDRADTRGGRLHVRARRLGRPGHGVRGGEGRLPGGHVRGPRRGAERRLHRTPPLRGAGAVRGDPGHPRVDARAGGGADRLVDPVAAPPSERASRATPPGWRS